MIATLLALSLTALDDSKLKIQPNPTAGATRSLSFDVLSEIQGHDSELKAVVVTTITKVGPGRTEYTVDWQKMELTEGGDPEQLRFKPYQVAVGPHGEVLDLKGGLGEQGADPVCAFLVGYFPITDSELEKGKPLTFTLPGDGKRIPELKVTETLIGGESLGGVDCFKIRVGLHATKSDFAVDANYYVDKSGNVLKESGSYSKLPIPNAGITIDGTIDEKVIG